jgi:hypothetical protein
LTAKLALSMAERASCPARWSATWFGSGLSPPPVATGALTATDEANRKSLPRGTANTAPIDGFKIPLRLLSLPVWLESMPQRTCRPTVSEARHCAESSITVICASPPAGGW